MMRFTVGRFALNSLALVVALFPFGQNDLSDLLWLEGEWERQTRAGTVIERWTRSGGGLAGESLRLRGDESMHAEALMLVEMGDGVFYIARPAENPYPVAFLLVSRAGGEFVFENTTHDFPQRIIYSRVSDDAMMAAIEGPGEGGETQRIEFHFVRRQP